MTPAAASPGSAPALAEVAARLAKITDRHQLPPLILSHLGTVLARAFLFTAQKDELQGWDANGGRIRGELVRSLRVPLDQPSLFQQVMAEETPYDGPLPVSAVEKQLVVKLGGSWPEAVMIRPVVVRGRTLAVVYGETTTAQLEVARPELAAIVDLTAETLMRLIRSKRQR